MTCPYLTWRQRARELDAREALARGIESGRVALIGRGGVRLGSKKPKPVRRPS